jgi:enoyl-[acyl-carrier protein] reductase II
MLIDRFFDRGRKFLGCRYPIMCGAMTWVSDPKLVTAVGNAGGFGLLAGGNAPLEILERQIIESTQLSQNPFGVNLITLAPVYKDQLDLVCRMNCRFIVFETACASKTRIIRLRQVGRGTFTERIWPRAPSK